MALHEIFKRFSLVSCLSSYDKVFINIILRRPVCDTNAGIYFYLMEHYVNGTVGK
jgi:hypothetical protein